MFKKVTIGLFFFAVSFLIVGCAPDIVRSSIVMANTTGTKATITLKQSATVPGFLLEKSSLFQGSRWQQVGELSMGRVYKSLDSVFFIQSANSHEAYLVVNDKKQLVGFYLPGERAWSALEPVIVLDF